MESLTRLEAPDSPNFSPNFTPSKCQLDMGNIGLSAMTAPSTFMSFNGFFPNIKTWVASIYLVVAQKNAINNIGPNNTGIYNLYIETKRNHLQIGR